MKKPILYSRLKFFIKPHPELHPAGEKVFVPRDNLVIRFWFEGNLQVEGDENNLQINLNDDQLLVLALSGKGVNRIFRIPWQRLVSVELIQKDSLNKEFFQKIFLN